MRRLIPLLAIIPALAAGQVRPSIVNTASISRASPAHYVHVTIPTTLTVANGIPAGARAIYPGPGSGRLVNVIIHQIDGGLGGTSYTLDVKTIAATSLLTTLPVQTLASGSNKACDTKGVIAVPSGWTRGVLKSDATTVVAEGDRVNVFSVETGTFTTHATIALELVFEPLQ